MRQVSLTTDPMKRFVEGFRSEATRESYVKKLRGFLEFAQTTAEELSEKAQSDPQLIEALLLEYARLRRDSVSVSELREDETGIMCRLSKRLGQPLDFLVL